MSIAGGLHKAAEAAGKFGMDTVQIFTANPRQFPEVKTDVHTGRLLTKNNNQWRAKPLTEKDVSLFREALDVAGLQKPCAHDSYLINLASPKEDAWQKSLDAYVVELERAEALGLDGVVMHPGSFVESSEEEGLAKIIEAFNIIHEKTRGFQVQTWLETTAGQGTNLGHRFEHLATIIDGVDDDERLGVCVDSCHIFAAGYPLIDRKDYLATMREFDNVIGIDRIKAFHLNDSKKPLGSRVDRHDHIGEGELGLEPFRHILNDKRFKNLPMYLETKKEARDGEEMDGVNLATLRGLLK